MRGTQSKLLMKMTREERAEELKKGMPERDYVEKKTGSVVNHPWSLRAFYLQLKKRFLVLVRATGAAKLPALRRRGAFKPTTPEKPKRIALIQKPLDLILDNNLPTEKVDALGQKSYVPHPTYVKAARLAKRGDGAAVRRMAAAYA